MKVPGRTRALVILAASASLLALPLAAPASAAAKAPGKCTKLATKTVGGNIKATLSKCTPTAATGGKGTGAFKSQTGKNAGKLGITITWAAKKGTTKGLINFKTSTTSLGKCPAGSTSRITITGKVTGGSGTAAKTFKKGQPIKGSVCTLKSGSLALEPGTALTF
jgi:hypothetical protein